MSAYDASAWSDFAVGVAGASAALTGLLFVAVSINLERIIALAGLPRLAISTLILFSSALFGAIALLVPDQTTSAVGIELVALGLVTGIPLLVLSLRAPRVTQYVSAADWFLTRFLPAVLVGGFILVAGLSVLAKFGGGLYWLAAATVVAIGFGLMRTWVLLVEIQR